MYSSSGHNTTRMLEVSDQCDDKRWYQSNQLSSFDGVTQWAAAAVTTGVETVTDANAEGR